MEMDVRPLDRHTPLPSQSVVDRHNSGVGSWMETGARVIGSTSRSLPSVVETTTFSHDLTLEAHSGVGSRHARPDSSLHLPHKKHRCRGH